MSQINTGIEKERKVREKTATRFKTAYGKVERVQLVCEDVSLAKQSFAEETEINRIMARYAKSGIVDHVSRYRGNYGDFSEVTDYHSALLQVMEAREAFESLPAMIRAKFGNDPGSFLEFMQDPSNVEEIIELGLATPRSQETEDTPPEAPESDTGGDEEGA